MCTTRCRASIIAQSCGQLLLLVALLTASVFQRLQAAEPAPPGQSMNLKGTWRFELDRADRGLKGKWFARSLEQKFRLPGSLPAQGIGDDITVDTKWMGDIVDRSWFTAPEYARYRQPGNVKVPFWLQPDKYYAGAAWYQRDIEIPVAWSGRRVVLRLERPHWETRVWLDDREIGSNDSLSTPHEYRLGVVGRAQTGRPKAATNQQHSPVAETLGKSSEPNALTPGRHTLTIRVDNRLIVDVGVNSHSISDHTQGNWNGIVGDISLSVTAPVWVHALQVYPHFAKRSIKVKGRIGNATGESGSAALLLMIDNTASRPRTSPEAVRKSATWEPSGGAFEFELPVEDPKAWDEFEPVTYHLKAQLEDSGQSASASFGFRDLATEGTQFTLNGRKIFIRGTLECCIFPKTGHPPTEVEDWRRIIRIAKAYGLNLIRFHSWCPPEAAFIAADELGFYYQVEIASWANQSTTLGDGKPVDEWLYREAERILQSYGNHPSFLLMPYGNEPGGNQANAYLSKWVDHWKSIDPRRLYTSGSGWPELPENQFHVTPNPRIQSWGAGLKSRINGLPPETRTDYRDYISKRSVPVISHEIGEWCVYPNFDEIPKYTGYLKPKNLEIFRDSLEAHHMGRLAHQFLLASGKLQTLCYKEDIESALRTPCMGGFELLDLHDFPGQGTALVGVLDPFWDDKGYVTAREYSRFCNSTVPLARLQKRVFTCDEPLTADFEVAHFGPGPLQKPAVSWQLVQAGQKPFARGDLDCAMIPIGNGTQLGTIRVDLSQAPAPKCYRLVLRIAATESTRLSRVFENDWDVWVYPARSTLSSPPGIRLANDLDDAALASLQAGGKVLLTLPAERVRGDRLGKVALGFSSIFWNTAWTGRQPPHTLGILCDPQNPALADFPTDYHSNWQWWYLISRAGAIILDDLPEDLRPTVQVIDDWVTNRKLALVFEAKLGAGKLIVCSFDLTNGLDQNPVARQMLSSLLRYMDSRHFKPSVTLTTAQIKRLIDDPARLSK